VGLKTTYYLRSLGASNIEKATVAVKKEVRGVAGSDTSAPIAEGQGRKTYTAEEKAACSIEAMRRGEICEACQ
jgi:ribonucleoside-diphosphate reductase alpha chain